MFNEWNSMLKNGPAESSMLKLVMNIACWNGGDDSSPPFQHAIFKHAITPTLSSPPRPCASDHVVQMRHLSSTRSIWRRALPGLCGGIMALHPPQQRTFCSPSTRVTCCTPPNQHQLTMLSTSTPCWALQPLWNIHVRLPFHMMACAGYGIRIQTPPLTPAQVMAPEARCFDSTLGVCSGDNGTLSRGHDEALR